MQSEENTKRIKTKYRVTEFFSIQELKSMEYLLDFERRSLVLKSSLFINPKKKVAFTREEKEFWLDSALEACKKDTKEHNQEIVDGKSAPIPQKDRRLNRALQLIFEGKLSITKISQKSKLSLTKIKEIKFRVQNKLPIFIYSKKHHSKDIDDFIRIYFEEASNANKSISDIKKDLLITKGVKVSKKYISTKLHQSKKMYKQVKIKQIKKKMGRQEEKVRKGIASRILNLFLNNENVVFVDRVEFKVGKMPRGRWVNLQEENLREKIEINAEFLTCIVAADIYHGFLGIVVVDGSTTYSEFLFFLAGLDNLLKHGEQIIISRRLFLDQASWHWKASKILKRIKITPGFEFNK